MHSLGFKIKNTPFTDNANGTLYTQYYSAGPATVVSLMHSFCHESAISHETEYNNNIISLANQAGFKTYWLSNQGAYGLHDFSVAAIGKKANVSYFSNLGGFDDHAYNDDILLPNIESALNDNTPANKLIVIHLIGSHHDFCVRTADKYSTYYMSQKISCYVQSITNTDTLLESITQVANKSQSKWSLIYFSDHGLKMIDAKSHIVNDNYYSAMNFMSMFATWIGVDDPLIQHKCTPLSQPSCQLESINAFSLSSKMINVLKLPVESLP
jgi:glucan phosphoethanolaminetransferase (alkaline phosphatase superfamily)